MVPQPERLTGTSIHGSDLRKLATVAWIGPPSIGPGTSMPTLIQTTLPKRESRFEKQKSQHILAVKTVRTAGFKLSFSFSPPRNVFHPSVRPQIREALSPMEESLTAYPIKPTQIKSQNGEFFQEIRQYEFRQAVKSKTLPSFWHACQNLPDGANGPRENPTDSGPTPPPLSPNSGQSGHS
jgi:hypothetical protein